jgi:hypothetical protein
MSINGIRKRITPEELLHAARIDVVAIATAARKLVATPA